MEKGNINETQASKAATSSQKSSPLRLAAATMSGPNDVNLPSASTPRVDRPSKLDRKKRQPDKDKSVDKTCSDSSSVDTFVPIGAVSVTTRASNHEAGCDEEGANTEIDAVGVGASYEHTTVEAHVVEELSEEKERYEQETRERLLAELSGQAAQAVVVISEVKEPEGSSYLLRGCLCLLLVLIIAITAGVVLTSNTSSNSAGVASTTSSAPTDQESSDQPSLMPTFEPRNNTFCEEAHQLVVGQSISGSLEDSLDTVVPFCEYSSTSTYATSGPGRWYVYRGEGFPVIAKTDAFVDIHLYYDCYASCHYDAFYPNWGEGESTILWEAETGTEYFILVSGQEGMGQDNNPDFTLTFETNDSLETAYGPLTPGRDSVVGGSTVGTKVASDVPACGSASAPTGPGVWYKVTGNGRIITASTCGSSSGFDTQISVFTAGTNSSCIDGNDDFCSSKSQVAWSSTEDEIYFVLVHGKDDAEGTFILQFTTEGASLGDADFCANAESLEVGFSGPVDFSQATADPDLLNCTEASWIVGPTVIGNFYTFIGTGERVSVFLDSPNSWLTTNSPGAALLTGSSCNALECLSPCQDDTENYSSQVCTVRTVVGQKYYVYVYYIEEAYTEGDLDLNLNESLNLTIQVSDQ